MRSMARSNDEWGNVANLLRTSRANKVTIYLKQAGGNPKIEVMMRTSIKSRIKGHERRRERKEASISISGTETYLRRLTPHIISYAQMHELDHELIMINAKAGIIRDYLPAPHIDGNTIEEAAAKIKELTESIVDDLIIHLFDDYPDWTSITDMDYLFTDGWVRLKEDVDASIYGGYNKRYNVEYSVSVGGTWLINTNLSYGKDGFHVIAVTPRKNWRAIIELMKYVAPGDRLFFVDEDRDCVLPFPIRHYQ